MYNLKPLKRTKDLKRILTNQKKNKRSFSVLFVSPWDPMSNKILEALNRDFGDSERGEPVYIVDSFEMPDAFSDRDFFGTRVTPQLVQVRKDFTSVDDYVPIVIKKLRLSSF